MQNISLVVKMLAYLLIYELNCGNLTKILFSPLLFSFFLHCISSCFFRIVYPDVMLCPSFYSTVGIHILQAVCCLP
jgi:hypothetical protein